MTVGMTVATMLASSAATKLPIITTVRPASCSRRSVASIKRGGRCAWSGLLRAGDEEVRPTGRAREARRALGHGSMDYDTRAARRDGRVPLDPPHPRTIRVHLGTT